MSTRRVPGRVSLSVSRVACTPCQWVISSSPPPGAHNLHSRLVRDKQYKRYTLLSNVLFIRRNFYLTNLSTYMMCKYIVYVLSAYSTTRAENDIHVFFSTSNRFWLGHSHKTGPCRSNGGFPLRYVTTTTYYVPVGRVLSPFTDNHSNVGSDNVQATFFFLDQNR